MKITMNFRFLWKFALPVMAFLGAGLLTACDKESETPAGPVREPYEKELFFNHKNADSIEIQVVKGYAEDTACRHIYLTVTEDNDWRGCNANAISILRDDLAQRIDLAPEKISGRGDFWFKPGVVAYSDSLWLVQHGWTITHRDSIKVLTYTRDNASSLRYDTVMKYANDPRVTRIIYFLDSTNFNNDFRNSTCYELHNERTFLEKTINYAPTKAVGAGTYIIYPGVIYPDDSIWIITHGWKIKSSEWYYD